MSAGDHFMSHVSWEGIVSVLGALGLGSVLTAVVSRPSRRAVAATALKDEATGEAAVITSLAAAFTDTTASLREEIERMQLMLDALRKRVAEADTQLQAAAQREADLVRENSHLRTQLETSHGDVLRLRGERDAEREKTTQQEGEIRQLKAVIEAHARVNA